MRLAKSIRSLVEKKIAADRKGKLFDTHKTERGYKLFQKPISG